MSNTNNDNDQNRSKDNNPSIVSNDRRDTSNLDDYNDIYLQLPPVDPDQLLLSPPCSPIPVNWEQQVEDAPHIDSFELELRQLELEQQDSKDMEEDNHHESDDINKDSQTKNSNDNNAYIRRGVLVSNNGPKITIDCYL